MDRRASDITLARRVKHWRKVAGLSKVEFAAAVGVSLTTVYLWEKGKTLPSGANLERIALACGVELRTFFGDIPNGSDSSSPIAA